MVECSSRMYQTVNYFLIFHLIWNIQYICTIWRIQPQTVQLVHGIVQIPCMVRNVLKCGWNEFLAVTEFWHAAHNNFLCISFEVQNANNAFRYLSHIWLSLTEKRESEFFMLNWVIFKGTNLISFTVVATLVRSQGSVPVTKSVKKSQQKSKFYIMSWIFLEIVISTQFFRMIHTVSFNIFLYLNHAHLKIKRYSTFHISSILKMLIKNVNSSIFYF